MHHAGNTRVVLYWCRGRLIDIKKPFSLPSFLLLVPLSTLRDVRQSMAKRRGTIEESLPLLSTGSLGAGVICVGYECSLAEKTTSDQCLSFTSLVWALIVHRRAGKDATGQ